MTFCSRRPNHMREAEDLHPTPTPALTPTRAIAKPIGSAPGTPQKATFSAWLPGRVNRTPGALREPPKRPKRSQNASPRPPKNLQKKPKPGRGGTQRSPVAGSPHNGKTDPKTPAPSPPKNPPKPQTWWGWDPAVLSGTQRTSAHLKRTPSGCIYLSGNSCD